MEEITKEESHSSQRLFQWYCFANSMALIAPESSAWNAFPTPLFSAKQRRMLEMLSLKTPPQEASILVDEPSVLHFTQLGGGGLQRTSMILGALGG